MASFSPLISFAAGLLVRSTVVFLVTIAALFALRRSSAATRHRVAVAGLGAALALPLLSFLLPHVSVPALPRLTTGARAAVSGWTVPLLAFWVAGTAAVAARLFVGWARVRELARDATLLRDAEWVAERDAAAERLGLDRPVALKESADVPVAITSGWRRPFLLVGRAARLWAVERRRVVLLHELAHVKRADWPTLFVTELAVAAYWFHPLALWLGRRVRREAEQACDELVIASGTKPSVYAGHLLGIFRTVGAAPAPAAAALAIARPHQFEARLRAILDPHRTPGGAARGGLAVAGLVAATAVVTVVGPCNPTREIALVRPHAAAAPAAASSGGEAKKPCPHASPKAEMQKAAAKLDEKEASVEEKDADDAPAEASDEDLPTLPDEGKSLPAVWRADAREVPRTGFVLASNKKESRRDGGEWYDRGMSLHHKGRYEQAIQAFENAIADGYREDAASYNIACGYALLGNRDKAFEWLHKAAEWGFDVSGYMKSDDDLEGLHDDPRWAEMKKEAREAKTSSEKAKEKSVAARYDRLVARAPQSGEGYFDMGRELLRVDRYDLAAQAFQTSADKGYRVGTSLYNQACALSLDGKKDAAIASLQKSLDAGFDQPDIYAHDDDLDNVRSDPRFRTIERDAEDLSLPGYSRGPWGSTSRSERKKWREAAQRFQTYAEKHPQVGRAWYNLGFALLAGDRADDAAAPFQKALDLGYRKPTTMYNLACTYARLDQKDAAFDWLFKALDAGFDETWTMRFDDDLDNLRGDSRYRKAFEMARARDRSGDKD
ncbi:MAG TPA: M56 family metallopeptidase [Thermoanaerobaculia bacterium]|nr:M56 family metallopeptidase [Thermoanaerobaculia bacterium]